MSTLSTGTESRVRRVLSRAGFGSMWGELKSGAYGRQVGPYLVVISDGEDCDHCPDPRDVDAYAYRRSEDGEWITEVAAEVGPGTLRAALEWARSLG